MASKKVGAGCLIVTKTTGRALFSIRSPHKSHRLTWGLWGGMQNKKETPIEAMLREVKEEMGFMPDFLHIEHFDLYNSPDGKFQYHTYVCIVEKEFSPWISSENCGYCWMNLGIWPRPMHYGAKKTLCTDAALEKINSILQVIN